MSSKSSSNMLRTRRKDINNLKPNRRDFRAGRLDRKSSRGMIYENEELRLRTININAEIERGQYDIKKLKRENELLKKEIWCLRDEYEKLDKLLKDKQIDFSSSSTTTSDTDSCSSCEDLNDANRELNEDYDKTNHKILNRDFEALSVVPEESDGTSLGDVEQSSLPHDDTVLQADQSYPNYVISAISTMSTSKVHVPAETETSDNDVSILPDGLYGRNFYQNIVLVPEDGRKPIGETLEKGAIDVLVKIDNKNFSIDCEPNGGSEGYIDRFKDDFPRFFEGPNSHSTFSNGGNLEELLNDIENISQDILAMSNKNDSFSNRRCKSDINPTEVVLQDEGKPFKSELNVTLMPQPMALIGLEKYKDIRRSMNSTPSKSLENLSGQDLQYKKIEEDKYRALNSRVYNFYRQQSKDFSKIENCPKTPESEGVSSPIATPLVNESQGLPNYLSNLRDNYVDADYFARYKSGNCKTNDLKASESVQETVKKLAKQQSFDVNSSENDENVKIKTNQSSNDETTLAKTDVSQPKETKQKKSLRKKVSIHFRGKKEKQKKNLEVPPTINSNSTKTKQSPLRDKKLPDVKVDDKIKTNNLPKLFNRDRTVSESDGKNLDNKRIMENSSIVIIKQQKSSSVSPDRRKIKEDKKCNKKHKKDRMKTRRTTVTSLESRDQRARSQSAGTERSNTHFPYDDYLISERESLSSCETLKNRQINFSNIPIGGKVPWCGCWGNGCI